MTARHTGPESGAPGLVALGLGTMLFADLYVDDWFMYLAGAAVLLVGVVRQVRAARVRA